MPDIQTAGPIHIECKIRLAWCKEDMEFRVTDDGKYGYIINCTDNPVEIKIDVKSGKFMDIWNEKNGNLSGYIMFQCKE